MKTLIIYEENPDRMRYFIGNITDLVQHEDMKNIHGLMQNCVMEAPKQKALDQFMAFFNPDVDDTKDKDRVWVEIEEDEIIDCRPEKIYKTGFLS